MPGLTRVVRRRLVAGVLACTMTSMSACVHWQSVTPPAHGAQVALPRLVHVTRRDSTHVTLEHATFLSDTLVGRALDEPNAPLARIATADIAHLEAREPSLSRSLTVIVIVLGVVSAFFWALGHAVAMS